MNLNGFFHRTYHKKNYNCMHFVCEVGETLGIPNIRQIFGDFMNMQIPNLAKIRSIEIIPTPEDLCLVYFSGKGTAHIGLWVANRVFHITSKGVKLELLDTAKIGFRRVRFLKCNR